jgi:hypothetical protein
VSEADKTGLWGIVILTLLVLLFLGPGFWSSSERSPWRELWDWLKRRGKPNDGAPK